jgi:Holliday junction resolvase RusA-like endonuclease
VSLYSQIVRGEGPQPGQLSFTIPGDPVPYARMIPTMGGVVQPTKARAYQKHAATHAMLAARKAGWKRLPAKALVGLQLNIYRSARRADLSNFVKIIEDAFNDSKAIWHDDRYVISLRASMRVSADPRVEVTVTPLTTTDEEDDAS